MSDDRSDRLFELLPVVYRLRDADRGQPLQALLRVIAGQVNLVEDNIDQLYDNWFIETCEDWVVPYLGDLVGYRMVSEAGLAGSGGSTRNQFLIPRQEVANTIAFRRRKGTLALLELLAQSTAGWPARAVEFFRLLGLSQSSRSLAGGGQSIDLHKVEPLYYLDGPFDLLPHTVDVRGGARGAARYNIPGVGLFVWRLRAHSITHTPAYNYEQFGPNVFTFSTLGNDSPLFNRAEPETETTTIAGRRNVPERITRHAMDVHTGDYYGPGKSLQIWVGQGGSRPPVQVPIETIVSADLSDWYYRPKRGQVAVDPVLGRIVFHPREAPRYGVWVSYFTAFSDDIGGGEYDRPIRGTSGETIYRVGEGQPHATISSAVAQWTQEAPPHAVIEITTSGVYVEPVTVRLQQNQTLQLRAANHVRPVIRLLDWQTDRPDALWITGETGSRFILDGMLITGRGIQVQGPLRSVTIRHTTLTPGWSLFPDCEPRRPNEPSIELTDTAACLVIEQSIVGSIQVNQDEVEQEPLLIKIRGSILDATSMEREALGAPGGLFAHAVLTAQESTIIGQVQTHAIELAEDSIFLGRVRVARRQRGCMRFCYVDPQISRTPRRFQCQPDLALRAVEEERDILAITDPVQQETVRQREREAEALRVLPRFDSLRYGTPEYCRLSTACAPEITRGASDESEMGVFHRLYQPQRAANLRARLDEYLPAGMTAGIILI